MMEGEGPEPREGLLANKIRRLLWPRWHWHGVPLGEQGEVCVVLSGGAGGRAARALRLQQQTHPVLWGTLSCRREGSSSFFLTQA